MDPNVPLVVPEVNPDAAFTHKGVIASPNCSTTQMVVAMKPIYDASRIRRVVVSTYQATSGAGVAGQRDLIAGSEGLARRQGAQVRNVRPSDRVQSDSADRLAQVQGLHLRRNEDGVRDPQDLRRRRDSGLPDVRPRAGLELPQREHPGRDRAEDHGRRGPRAVRQRRRASSVIDDLANGKYPMPKDCDGDDATFVGRIREDLSCDNGLAFWCVSDNLRKGAATNAVQIAELLVRTQAAV